VKGECTLQLKYITWNDRRCLLGHAHSSRFGSLEVKLSGLLGNSAKSTTPDAEAITAEASLESVLFSDLSSDGNSATQRAKAHRDEISASTFVFFNSGLLVGNLANSTQPRNTENFAICAAIKETSIPVRHFRKGKRKKVLRVR